MEGGVRGAVNTVHASLTRGEYALIFAFWTLYAVLAATGALLDPRSRFLDAAPYAGQLVLPFAQAYLWALLTPLIFMLVVRVGMGTRPPAERVLLLLAAGLLIAMAVDVVLAVIRMELFPLPRPRRFGPMRIRPLQGLRRLWFLDDFVIFAGVLAAGFARGYSIRLRARQEESARLQAEAARLASQLAESRLAVLRSQLDPHFLFNTLHAVSALVTTDPRGVRRMISLLSELLRRSLDGGSKAEVPLRDELEFSGRYLEIMQIRFQGSLVIETRAAPETLDALVPTLLLQPLVENAIRHGLGDAAREGHIEISAHREGDELVVGVEDDGEGMAAGATEGVGLRNTRERLAALYGDAQRLTLGRGSLGGLRVVVRLPFHTAADLRLPARATGEE
ncbi:MAG TPA: histidine kinase [Longimicrobiales bacterium]|nr:histidine kinase [Longimicrobiales bacterium]